MLVSNLPYTVTSLMLAEAFAARCGPVIKADILLDARGSIGKAVVLCETAMQAMQAVQLMHGASLGGRKLVVRLAHGAGPQ